MGFSLKNPLCKLWLTTCTVVRLYPAKLKVNVGIFVEASIVKVVVVYNLCGGKVVSIKV